MSDNITFLDHLDELRSVFIKVAIILIIIFPFGYYYSLHIVDFLKRLSYSNLNYLVYLQPLELFFTRIKIALFVSAIISFPFMAFQVWSFVTPALLNKEKKIIKLFSLCSSLLFLLGGLLGLFLVFPAVIKFALLMGTAQIHPMISVQSFINLSIILVFGFGLVFQLPIFVFALTVSGLIDIKIIKKSRPLIVVIILVMAAVLTPPDIISQIAMAAPSLILFE
ncbi:MAG: twin-arginine translocase subunit TatC, partial [bacterium]|nr:twin-arginine translocase subunit TatC [bacterium]